MERSDGGASNPGRGSSRLKHREEPELLSAWCNNRPDYFVRSIFFTSLNGAEPLTGVAEYL
jgi:hypothetical protein